MSLIGSFFCLNLTEGCSNKLADDVCEKRATAGECSRNPKTLLVDCKKSCLCFKGDGNLISNISIYSCSLSIMV